jgi:hypothetical protein
MIWNLEGSCACAQDLPRDEGAKFFLFDFGIGSSSIEGGSGDLGILSLGANLAYQTRKNLFSIRAIRSSEVSIATGLPGGTTPKESVWDIGLLYGRIANASFGSVSMSAGISLVGGVRRGELLRSSGLFFATKTYEEQTFWAVGIPIDGRIFWTPSPYFGIGICGFADWNRERSFIGGLLCIRLISQQ